MGISGFVGVLGASFRTSGFFTTMAFALKRWKRDRRRLAAIVFLLVIATAADGATPYFVGRLIQSVADLSPEKAASLQRVYSLVFIIATLGLVAITLRPIAYRAVVRFTLKMMNGMVAESFAHVHSMSTSWHNSNLSGSTARAISRGAWALDLLNDTILTAVIPKVIMLFMTVAIVGSIWWPAGIFILLLSVVFVAVAACLSIRYVAPIQKLANRADSKVGGIVNDSLTSSAAVKAFAAEAKESNRLRVAQDKWTRRSAESSRRGILTASTQECIMLVMRIGLILGAVCLWSLGAADAGTVGFAITTFLILQSYIRDIGFNFRNVQRSVSDMEEVVNLLQCPLAVKDLEGATAVQVKSGSIRFSDVSFSYGDKEVFRGLNLFIRGGEHVGIVGPSGAGKSSLIKLLHRLYEPTSGRISIDEQDIARVTLASLRTNIAVVQQDPTLFHRSIADNIQFGRPDSSMCEVVQAAQLARADEFIRQAPKGYNTTVGERGLMLSGGERQRIAIARAFLADTPIMIFDEATSSLDSESESQVQFALQELLVKRTAIVIAHRLATVKSMDRILVMEAGEIVEEGTHASLMQIPTGIYRAFVEKQVLI